MARTTTGLVRKIGVYLSADGTEQYVTDLSNARRATRLAVQETKVAMSELSIYASTTDKFNAKMSNLTATYKGQQEQLKLMKSRYEQLIAEVKPLNSLLDKNEKAWEASRRETKALSAETDRLGEAYDRAKRSLDEKNNELTRARKVYSTSNAEIKLLKTEISELNKEVKEQTAVTERAGKAYSDSLADKKATVKETENLKKAYEEEKESLSKLQKELENKENSLEQLSKTNQEYKKSIDEANVANKKFAEEVHDLKTAHNESKRATKDSEAETKRLADATKETQQALDGYTKEIDENIFEQNKHRISMGLTRQEMEKAQQDYIKSGGALADQAKQLEKFSNTTGKIGSGLKSIGSSLTTHVTVPLVGVGTAAVTVGVNFEKQMSRVQAILQVGKGEMQQLSELAKQLGADTIFSASEVASGMENLATAGFNVNEIMGAMSGVLDLASISGNDVALAAEVAATSIRSFGLEAGDATHVADVLAKTAADTNAEVRDTGEAFKYVAPIAGVLGLSIEEVASAIGIMADQGIKGSQAGTTLRRALTNLANPTEKAAGLMEELGFSAFDAEGKIKPLPQIMAELAKATEGMTDQQKQAALATIFGQQALTGMNILTEDAGVQMGKYAKELENAEGAARKMGETLTDNTFGHIEEALGALETAAIDLTNVLAPHIKTFADFIKNVADAFSELSFEQQESILKMGLLAAAAGPVLSIFGNLFEVVSSGAGALGWLTKAWGGHQAAVELAGKAYVTASDGGKVLISGLDLMDGKVTGTTSVLGSLVKGLVGLPLPVKIVAGVLTAGAAAWKIWGEDAVEAANRTERWGVEVNETTDQTLSSIKNFSSQATGEMDLMMSGIQGSTESLSESFSKMGDTIQNDLNTRIKDLEDALNRLPNAYDKTRKSLEEEKKALEESSQAVSQYYERANEIRQKAADENRELSYHEVKQLTELNQLMAEEYVKTLKISEEERKALLDAMNGDVENATKEQATTWAKGLAEQRKTLEQEHGKLRSQLKKMWEEEGWSTDAINEKLKQFDDEFKTVTDSVDSQLAKLTKKFPELVEEVNFATGQTIDKTQAGADLIIQNNKRIIDSQKWLSKEYTDSMMDMAEDNKWYVSEAVKHADTWNNLIVFDEKKGVLKAETRDAVIEASKDVTTWNQIRPMLHEANLSSNAKAVIGEAAVANDWWEGMSLEEKHLVLQDDFSIGIYEAIKESGRWNDLTLEEKMAIVRSNTAEKMAEVLIQLGLWDELQPEIKELGLDTYDFFNKLAQSETALEHWAGLNPEEKDLLLNNQPLLDKIYESEASLAIYNQIPDDEKTAYLNNVPLLETLLTSQDKWAEFQSLDDETKQVFLNNAEFLQNLTNAGIAWDDFTNPENAVRQMVIEHNIGGVHHDLQNLYGFSVSVDGTVVNIPTTTSAPNTQGQVNSLGDKANNVNGTPVNIPTSTNAETTTGKINRTSEASVEADSKSVDIPTDTNAEKTTKKIKDTTASAQEADKQEFDIPGDTNADEIKGKVNSATESAVDTSFTITGKFSWVGRAANWALNFLGLSGGSRHVPTSGIHILGDGGRREPYLTPSGFFGISGNRDELTALPKGTRVWPSRQAFKTEARTRPHLKQYLDQIPKFAKGGVVNNPFDGYTGLVGEAGPELFQIAKGKVSITPISQGQRTKALNAQQPVDMTETNELLRGVIQLLAQGQVIMMDGEAVGRNVFDTVNRLTGIQHERDSVMRIN